MSFVAIDMDSIGGWACCGGAVILVLLIITAISGSKRKKGRTKKGVAKRSRLDAYQESDEMNQRIIAQAYRQFDRLSADEIRALGKQLGKDSIGEPPTIGQEVLKHLASAKRLDTATTLKQIISIRGELDVDGQFLAALDAKLIARIEAILSARWNKLEARAAKKITDKVCEDWHDFTSDLDEFCQGGMWSSYGPVPELIWSWHGKVEARANAIEDQRPD